MPCRLRFGGAGNRIMFDASTPTSERLVAAVRERNSVTSDEVYVASPRSGYPWVVEGVARAASRAGQAAGPSTLRAEAAGASIEAGSTIGRGCRLDRGATRQTW
jgi:hypothetical protein